MVRADDRRALGDVLPPLQRTGYDELHSGTYYGVYHLEPAARSSRCRRGCPSEPFAFSRLHPQLLGNQRADGLYALREAQVARVYDRTAPSATVSGAAARQESCSSRCDYLRSTSVEACLMPLAPSSLQRRSARHSALGGEENLQIRVRQHDGADVAPVHYDAVLPRQRALHIQQEGPDAPAWRRRRRRGWISRACV